MGNQTDQIAASDLKLHSLSRKGQINFLEKKRKSLIKGILLAEYI